MGEKHDFQKNFLLSGGGKFVSVTDVNQCEIKMRLFRFPSDELNNISTLFYLREMPQTFYQKFISFPGTISGSKFGDPIQA